MRRTITLILWIAAAIGLCALPATSTAGPDASSGVPAAEADAFVESVGVVSHFDYWNTSYNTAWPAIGAALLGSGIRHIRDGMIDRSPLYRSRLELLGRHGVNHSAMFDIDSPASEIDAMLALFEPYVDFVEPPNEYNNRHDPNWPARLAAEQKVLWNAVHANPAYRNVVVLGPSMNFAQYYASLGPLDDDEDAGNLHNYPCNLNPGTNKLHFGIATNHALIRASTVRKPVWTTETGYGDDLTLTPQCGLPDEVIAIYVPRMFAERWLAGEPRTYLYQLADMPSDRRFGTYGLLHADGSPKPQFLALTSLLHLLADPGGPFGAVPQRFTAVAQTPDLQQIVLQKRDGTYDVLLWREVESADPRTSAPLRISPVQATVSVPAQFRQVTAYAYGAGWALHGQPLAVQNGAVRTAVSDKISVLAIGR
ncbi:MAG: hypothetical protein ACLPSH_10510 [Vulcanimicrobiaceae bacterium]